VGEPSSRLHLYVGLSCPWAHRTLVVRALLGLEARLPVSVAVPGDDGAWSFTPGSPDRLYGKQKLREVYALRSGGFEGRASVPMLWDAERREVVCNESIEIVKFLCGLADDGDGDGGLDLWQPELRQDIDRWYSLIYPASTTACTGISETGLLCSIAMIRSSIAATEFSDLNCQCLSTYHLKQPIIL
jgi:putative glutathione S-transferase